MTWTRTAHQFLDCAPDDLWAVIGDPTRLPEWQPGWAVVGLDGPVAVGTTGRMVPAGAVRGRLHRVAAGAITVTALDEGHSITVEQPQPGGRWTFTWTVTPTDGGSVVSQVHSYDGLAVGVNGAVIGDELADFDLRCVRLRSLLDAAPVPDALRVVIPGGTGLLGRHLAADLVCRGHQVVLLTRSVRPELPLTQLEWDGRTVGAWADGLFDDPAATAVVNLAGASVGARPTRSRIDEFTRSRVDSTRTILAAARAAADEPLAAWVQASTTAIWGDAGESRCTEATPIPYGRRALPQMTGVAAAWESALVAPPARHHHILRTSLVLSRDAELVGRLSSFARLGLGGRMGDGQQWISWISLPDWLTVVRSCLGLESVTVPDGVVVAASPTPVRNGELMSLIRSEWKRPPAPPTVTALATVGGWVMGTDPALGLTGRHATSTVLAEAGFDFADPEIGAFLHTMWR